MTDGTRPLYNDAIVSAQPQRPDRGSTFVKVQSKITRQHSASANQKQAQTPSTVTVAASGHWGRTQMQTEAKNELE